MIVHFDEGFNICIGNFQFGGVQLGNEETIEMKTYCLKVFTHLLHHFYFMVGQFRDWCTMINIR